MCPFRGAADTKFSVGTLSESTPTASAPYGDSLAGCASHRDERFLASSESRALLDRLFPLIYRQMRSLSARRPGAFDELVQIAAEQALKSFHTFRGRSALDTWTYRICYRVVVRHERHRLRWWHRYGADTPVELDDRADTTPGADVELERKERITRLRHALTKLSPKRRAIVVLHDLEERSVASIAKIVDAKEATVRTRLRDGRRQLSKLLAQDPYFGDQPCLSEMES